MQKIIDAINKAVADELERANEKFPLFHSLHEGYAVIQEEIDEVIDSNSLAMANKEKLWGAIKADDIFEALTRVNNMWSMLAYATAEMVQVLAMCDKFVMSAKERR